jgi:hypothetical protein
MINKILKITVLQLRRIPVKLVTLLPKITSDEIDLEIDVNRDAEITAEKPPHHF